MTLEEAKQLKPGDRVLVEMEVFSDSHNHVIGQNGYVWLVRGFAKPESIREKLEPTTRRKFRKGDIVSRNGRLYYVAGDEDEGFNIMLDCGGDGKMFTDPDLLTLELSVEDRAARKEGV